MQYYVWLTKMILIISCLYNVADSLRSVRQQFMSTLGCCLCVALPRVSITAADWQRTSLHFTWHSCRLLSMQQMLFSIVMLSRYHQIFCMHECH